MMVKRTTMTQILNLCEELEPYARMEGSELGDYWRGLISFAKLCDYSSDAQFHEVIKDKLEEEVKRAKKHFKIVEAERTVKRKELKRKTKEEQDDNE